MFPPHVQKLASHLAAMWHKRWIRATSLLRRDPAHADAWLWHLQARILSFLLKTYGERAGLDHVPAFFGPDPRLAIDRELGAPPRSREAIRIILERIALANRL